LSQYADNARLIILRVLSGFVVGHDVNPGMTGGKDPQHLIRERLANGVQPIEFMAFPKSGGGLNDDKTPLVV